jgi:hypothetical protein
VSDAFPASVLPTWVYKRDRRLVPFEADKICRSLFAATEAMGKPDAFLARELTDGILHFLTAEAGGTVPTTAQIAEGVVKIVRELGQPALAQAFDQYSRERPRLVEPPAPTLPATAAPRISRAAPTESRATVPNLEQMNQWFHATPAPAVLKRRASAACFRAFALEKVFTRDLTSAHAKGLLTLTGLEWPLELLACVLDPPRHDEPGVVEAIESAGHVAGQVIAIDGPEYALALSSGGNGMTVDSYLRELGIGLRATGLRAVVNLNCSSPPVWADDLAEGPLFARSAAPSAADSARECAESVANECLEADIAATPVEDSGRATLRIDWHLSEREVQGSGLGRLEQLCRHALEGGPLAFVFDRARRPVAVAEGLDRRHTAVLLAVGLHLPQLLQQSGLKSHPEGFLQKLGSLARLALSAGVQKRDFLRRNLQSRPALTRGFRLDRARLVVVPIGLDYSVRELAGQRMAEGPSGLELARKIVERLRSVLDQDGRSCRLDTWVDSGTDFTLQRADEPVSEESWPDLPHIAGLTAWDPDASFKQQLKAAGAVHAGAQCGTAALVIRGERTLTAGEVADLLSFAWRETEITRLRLVRSSAAPHQLTAPWEQG